jgi:hypothetical protein
VYGFLALVLSGVAVRLIFGATNWTLLAVWLGTPLLFYMYVAPGFSHACSAFTVAAFVVLWLRVRRDWSWSGAATLGAMAAVMGMVREQDLFIAVGPAIDYVVHLGRSVRRGDSLSAGFGAPLAGLLAFAVCYLPQAIAYVVLNGRLGPSPTVAGKMTWTAPYAWQVLASPDHGLLFWTPLALPALLGVAYLGLGRLRDRPALASDVTTRVPDAWVGFLCLLMVMTQFYVTGSLSTWMGAGSFGQRRLVGLTVFFALGLATLYRVARPAWLRHALSGLVVVCVWWNLGLIAQFGVGLMNRQRLEPARNAYDNFVTIPRVLPELAYRYVFDRESFYQTRTRSAP